MNRFMSTLWLANQALSGLLYFLRVSIPLIAFLLFSIIWTFKGFGKGQQGAVFDRSAWYFINNRLQEYFTYNV